MPTEKIEIVLKPDGTCLRRVIREVPPIGSFRKNTVTVTPQPYIHRLPVCPPKTMQVNFVD